jgi:hypothetical protein
VAVLIPILLGHYCFICARKHAKISSETCGNARRADKQLKYEII